MASRRRSGAATLERSIGRAALRRALMSSEMHQPPRRDVPPSPQATGLPAAGPPPPQRREEIASVPRRYGPGTLMVVTAAYAILFAGFKALGADQAWWIGTAVFLTGIGIAQMISGPHGARRASAVAGAILLPLVVGGTVYAFYLSSNSSERWRHDEFMNVAGLVCFAVLGAPFGYLGGTVVAG